MLVWCILGQRAQELLCIHKFEEILCSFWTAKEICPNIFEGGANLMEA